MEPALTKFKAVSPSLVFRFVWFVRKTWVNEALKSGVLKLFLPGATFSNIYDMGATDRWLLLLNSKQVISNFLQRATLQNVGRWLLIIVAKTLNWVNLAVFLCNVIFAAFCHTFVPMTVFYLQIGCSYWLLFFILPCFFLFLNNF